ncbi:hypothetical protein D3OALGA1CA_3608 [Olavius algarvensis associated proteobacterium Delta 3]|nr:hypothetical protein D3OALGA1CA_3608 [Olavius algarvensis associated proteobacterium Delta 3]
MVCPGWLILGERFTVTQTIASAAIFAGIYLSQAGNGKERLSREALPA